MAFSWSALWFFVLTTVLSVASGSESNMQCTPTFFGEGMKDRGGVPREHRVQTQIMAVNVFKIINQAIKRDFQYLFSTASFLSSVPKAQITGETFRQATLPPSKGGFFASTMKAIQFIPHVMHDNVDPAYSSIFTNRSMYEADPWHTHPDKLHARYQQLHKAERGDGNYSFIRITGEAGRMRVVSDKQKDYYPVHYVEPRLGNEMATGLDLGQLATERNALMTAEKNIARITSGRIYFAQSVYEQYGFISMYPVYQKKSSPDWFVIPAQHPNVPKSDLWPAGFVLGVFIVEDILAADLDGRVVLPGPARAGANALTLVYQKLGYAGLDGKIPDEWYFMAGFADSIDSKNQTTMENFNREWKSYDANISIVSHHSFCETISMDGSGTLWKVILAVDYGCQTGEYLVSEGIPGQKISKCAKCPEGIYCSGLKDQSEGRRVLPGFFARTENNEPSVYACRPEKVCLGGPITAQKCLGGRTGFLCTECPDGQSSNDEGCMTCGFSHYLVIVFVAVIAVFLTVATLKFAMAKYVTQDPNKINALLVAGGFLIFVQVLASFGEADFRWGEPLSSLLNAVALAAFDLETINIQCMGMGMGNAVVQYCLKMVMPLMALVVMIVAFFTAKKAQMTDFTKDGFINAIGQVITIFFITLSLATLLPFSCFDHPNGKKGLSHSPEVLCWDSGDHTVMVIAAVLAVMVYLLGTIAVVFWATFRYPFEIIQAHVGFVQQFRFLFLRWKPDAYWFCSALIVRNFLIALFPMVVPKTSVDVCAVLLHFTVLGYLLMVCAFTPWRSPLLNSLDALSSIVLEVIVTVGSLSVYGKTVSGELSTLMVVCLSFVAIGFIGAFIYKLHKLSKREKQFTVFLSHYKKYGACTCRFLKVVLQKESVGEIFFDCDNLVSFGGIFDAVKDSKLLLCVLNGGALFRPWVVGEVVTAHQCKIPLVTCTIGLTADNKPDMKKMPSNKNTSDFTAGDFSELSAYGISAEDIAVAVNMAADMEPIHLNLNDWASSKIILMNVMPEKGLMKRISNSPGSTRSASTVGDAGMSADVMIMSDTTDVEAVSSSLVLKWMLQEMLQKAVTVDAGMTTPQLHKLLGDSKCNDILWLLTPYTLKSPPCLARVALINMIRGVSSTMPIIIGDTFEFPTDEYYGDLAGEDTQFGPRDKVTNLFTDAAQMTITPAHVIAALRLLFKSVIGLKIDIGNLNEGMLKASVRTVATRIQNAGSHVWNPAKTDAIKDVAPSQEASAPAPARGVEEDFQQTEV